MNFVYESKNHYVPIDIIENFSNYISLVDKFNLKKINKYMFNNLKIKKSQFETILTNKIDSATKSKIGKDLIELIEESKGLISICGSTIHQCLFNEFRSNSDIDICIQYDSNYINEHMRGTGGDFYEKLIRTDYIKNLFNLIKNKTKLIPESNIVDY